MFSSSHLSSILLSLVFLLACASPVAAVLVDWDGGGGDDLLSTAKNWVGDQTPANDGSDRVRFAGSVRPKPVAQIPWDFGGIVFTTNATSFGLSGATLDIGWLGISSGSPNTQLIENDMVLTADQSWTTEQGLLRLRGDIDFGNYSVTVWENPQGNAPLELAGNLSNGSLVYEAGSVLTLGGLVAIDVDIVAGTLAINTDQPQPPLSSINFADGTAVRSLGTHNIQQSFLVSGQLTYDGTGTLRSANSIFGSGSLRVAASASAVLGLGQTNVFSPFTGPVEVVQGQLELNGDGSIAQLGGSLVVGNNSGASHTAVLRGAAAGVITDGLAVEVGRDGLLELVGPVEFASLDLIGGDLQISDRFVVEPLRAHASSRTATINSPWQTAINGLDYDLICDNGSAVPDVLLAQGCIGPGTLRISGGGSVELRGDPALGPKAINVMAGALHLQRSGGSTVLETLGGSNSTIKLLAEDQLGGCDVNLLPGATFDLDGHQGRVGSLYARDAQVVGCCGTLIAEGPLNIVGTVNFSATLAFSSTAADIDVAPGAILTTDVVSENELTGTALALVGGGRWEAGTVAAPLQVVEGTLRIAGQIGGDLQVEDTLEIPAAVGNVQVSGSVQLGGNSTLVVDLDASGASAGDSWTLLSALSLVGTFPNVQLPPAPADHYWDLEYSSTEVVLRLGSALTDVGPPSALTRELALSAYPSPFNPRTTLQFDLPAAGPVRLELFDVRGRWVARLLDEQRPAGRHEMGWDGRDGAGHELYSGVYYLRLVHSAGERVRRVVLLR